MGSCRAWLLWFEVWLFGALTLTRCVALRAEKPDKVCSVIVNCMTESLTSTVFLNALVMVGALYFDLNSEQRSRTQDIVDVRVLKVPGDRSRFLFADLFLWISSIVKLSLVSSLLTFYLECYSRMFSRTTFRNLSFRKQKPWRSVRRSIF